MSGVIVTANRSTAPRDILSGTTHRLTFDFDEVKRKAVMKISDFRLEAACALVEFILKVVSR